MRNNEVSFHEMYKVTIGSPTVGDVVQKSGPLTAHYELRGSVAREGNKLFHGPTEEIVPGDPDESLFPRWEVDIGDGGCGYEDEWIKCLGPGGGGYVWERGERDRLRWWCGGRWSK